MLRWITTLMFTCLFAILVAQQSLVRTFIDKNGITVDEFVTEVIPVDQRDPGPVVTPTRNAVMIQDVPVFDWCHGCGPTAAAMLAGYWDRKGYSNIYTGPTNGGVVPLTNSVWGPGLCPLSASKAGLDGLAEAGHVNRFFVSENSSGNDPFGTGDPTGSYTDCIADYMGTSQDWWQNADGWSRWNAAFEGIAYHDFTDCEYETPRRKDMMHGLRQFFESRGYVVTDNYTQRILRGAYANGFTFENYKSYINAGIPVMIIIEGHFMLGVGYDTVGSTVYLHNTWDHGLHSMSWGSPYSNRAHIGVGVITLAPVSIDCSPSSITQTQGQNTTGSQNLSISNPGSQILNYSCSLPVNSEVVLDETFATTSLPAGWAESYTTGSCSWFIDSGGIPSLALDGEYFAKLWSWYPPSETKLITPAMDLSTADSVTLTFYHAQASIYNADQPSTPYQDILSVYYKASATDPWTLLKTYPWEITGWRQEAIDLPNLSNTYFLAFSGYAYRGSGVCLDKVVVTKSNTTSTSWLSYNGSQTYAGSVAVGGEASNVPVTFNTSGMSAGTHTSSLIINNTSETDNPITVPITLNITSANSITTTAPTTGAVWQGGTLQTISWTYYGTCSTLTLKYATNGVTFFSAGSIPTVFGANNYTWTVPIISSTNAIIKLEEGDFPFYSTTSNEFSIIVPIISVNHTSISMGSILVGTTFTSTFNIANAGTVTLSGNITTPAGYSVDLSRGNSTNKIDATELIMAKEDSGESRNSLEYSIPGGANKTFTLTFAPTAMQAYNGNVTITHNAEGASKTISVTGQGVKPTLVPSVTSITLNSRQYLEMEEVFTIANTGNLPLNYTLSIPDSISWLKVNNSTTTSNTIAVGGSAQEIYLLLTSNTFNQGTYYGVVNGTSDDPDMLSFSIPVVVNLSSPITISSPTGGESIPSGSVKTITWNYDNPNHPSGTSVKLYYARITGPVIVWLSIATITCQTGENSYQWTAPTVFSNTPYKIRVSESSWPYYGHYTDTFTVVEGAPLPPINLQVSLDNENGDLQLTWGRAPVGTITGFNVYSCPNPLFATEDTTLLGTTTFEMRWIIPAAEIIDKQFYKVTAIREP